MHLEGLPWWFRKKAKILRFPARVESLILVGKLRSPDTHGVAKKKKPLERCSLSSGSPRVLPPVYHLPSYYVSSRCQTLERQSQCHVHFYQDLHKVGFG